MAACPECGAEFEVGDVEVGEIVVCPECGVELEVVSTGPGGAGACARRGRGLGRVV